MKSLVLILLLAFSIATVPVRAQDLPLPSADWKSVETDHFVVHYPSELVDWTMLMSARLESIHEAVSVLVSHSPDRKTTVIVDDPASASNGSAWPGPLILMYPTPPSSRSLIGENRSWSEIVSLHEYAHIAHFTRPSRNPLSKIIVRLLPVRVDPIGIKSPRWLLEGYATYIEGKLTGSGRPHGTWRPAILRQWALEGQLPAYEELDISTGFYGGSMAYLAGSAFLEWLIEKNGEESLPNLWRRMTARKKRSFGEAFAGVYGWPPSELYGRFTAELTGKALDVEDALSAQGIEEGELVQRLSWYTGDPAVSPDGEHIAVVLRSRQQPPRLVVWKWQEDPPSEKELERRRRILELDPEDVPDIEWKPPTKEPVATLFPSSGRAYSRPRFMPDGERLLVIRPEKLPNGRVRPDLFIWNFETGDVRRITRGASIHEADPSPDGDVAVGIQCLNGSCDLVEIDLETGAVTIVHKSAPDGAFYRPRFSPDGRRIVAGRQAGSDWQLVLMDRDGGNLRDVGPGDGACRLDALFTPDGGFLVCVSSRGGILNLELLDLESGGVRPLTRVTGAAVAPAINAADRSILFLNLRSRGYDLHRIELAGALPPEVTDVGVEFGPAGRIPVLSVPEFPQGGVGTPKSYGLGPRKYIVLPQGSLAREGSSYGLCIGSYDPVGRLGWTLGGLVADQSAWQGGSFRIAWRGFGPVIGAELFSARQYPSRNEEDLITPDELDVEYSGAGISVKLVRDRISSFHRGQLGAGTGTIDGPSYDGAGRSLVFAGLRHNFRQTPGNLLIAESLEVTAAMGETGGASWNRILTSFSLGFGRPGKSLLSGEVVYGETGGDPVLFEQFAVGGLRPTLFDGSILSQRISVPALPAAFLTGRKYASYKGEYLIGSVLSFYYWAGMAGEKLEGWEKIFGQEVILDSAAIPFLRVPGAQFRIGSGIRVDEPNPKKVRFYAAIVWRP